MKDPQSYADDAGFPIEDTLRAKPCTECGKPFTDVEWDARHDDGDDGFVHASCCVECRGET